MTDDRRRRDEQRLRRAQEIANAMREHHAQLAAALRGNTHRARTEPVLLAEHRRTHAGFAPNPFDDDVG